MSKEKWIAVEDTINLVDDHLEIRNCCAEYVCNKLNEKNQQIAELEKQLKNARKETAKEVIARVEELGVFDFEAYEERYIISEKELDNILKEYGK